VPAPGRSSRAIVPGASEVQGRRLHGHSSPATRSTPIPGPLPGRGQDRGRCPGRGSRICVAFLPLLRYSCDTPHYPSGSLSGWRSSPYGLLCGSLVRFYRDPPRYSALRLCPSFREGQPPGRGRCTRPGVRPGCSSGRWARSDHIRSILQSPPNTGGRLRSGGALTGCVPGVSRSDHIRSIRSGSRRLEGVRVFPGTAGTCRATVRNPGALRGRLGAGVVAYVPRYGAYVTLSRAPRETALYPVHCPTVTPRRSWRALS